MTGTAGVVMMVGVIVIAIIGATGTTIMTETTGGVIVDFPPSLQSKGRFARPFCFMANHRYLLFNKPYQVLSQFTQGQHASSNTPRATLSDFVPVPNVYPVGRLDYDSEGLLLLTSDGALQHRLTDPRFEHPKTYWAQVEGIITEDSIQQLIKGILIQSHLTRSCRAHRIDDPSVPPRVPPIRFRASIPVSWLEIILTEGRNRQVRRMTAAVGFPTLRLLRVAIGDFTLQGLAPGRWRELSPAELNLLRQQASSNKKGRPHSRSPLVRSTTQP